MRAAVISAGTNSCRLLIVRNDDGQLRIEHHDIRGTRLGQGTDVTGTLNADAMQRTVDAIEHFARLGKGAGKLFVIGTSALRDAANASQFIARVRDITGVELHILTGEEEARASFDGARWALEQAGRDYQEPLTVVDIGGGSTEIATRERVASLPIGAVRLTERFVKSDPPKVEELGACRTAVRLELDGFQIDRSGTLTFVGGTADTAARMLYAYDMTGITRVAELDLADLEDLLALVSSLPVEQRKRLHALPESRVDIFPTGLVIIDEIVRCANDDSFLVSESDLLIGYLNERLSGKTSLADQNPAP